MKTLTLTCALLIISLISSCQQNNKIKGDWYSCSSENGYSEFQFNEESIIINIESFGVYFCNPYEYEMKNDTIFLYKEKKETYDSYLLIKSSSENKIILDFVSPEKVFLKTNQKKIVTRYVLFKQGELAHQIASDNKNELDFSEKNSELFFKRKEENSCKYLYKSMDIKSIPQEEE
jgi:hypothetical protein